MKSSTHYRDKIIDSIYADSSDGQALISSNLVLSELLRFLDDETLGSFYNQRNGAFDGLREED